MHINSILVAEFGEDIIWRHPISHFRKTMSIYNPIQYTQYTSNLMKRYLLKICFVSIDTLIKEPNMTLVLTEIWQAVPLELLIDGRLVKEKKK